METVQLLTPGSPAFAHPYERIAVVGAGSWGTALACVARRAGREVVLWGRDAGTVDAINSKGENPRYLKGIPLEPGLHATTDLAACVAGAQAIMIVTPSKTLRDICRQIAPHIQPGTPIALCAKGIEAETGYLLNEVAAEELPGHPIGAISGPTFAHETVLDYPTAATVAFPFSYDDRLQPENSVAARFAISLSSANFRPYISDDIVGVEIGGAVKNVIAIALRDDVGRGLCRKHPRGPDHPWHGRDEDPGRGPGRPARDRHRPVRRGRPDADLFLGNLAQHVAGGAAGPGAGTQRMLRRQAVVVEGEVNAISVIDLAKRIGVSLPICEAVHAVLHEGADLRTTFRDLWARPIEGEPKGLTISLSHPTAAVAS